MSTEPTSGGPAPGAESPTSRSDAPDPATVRAASPGDRLLPGETKRERAARMGRRARLYTFSILLAALLVVLIALVLANTDQVQLSWVVGDTRASLVWIVLGSALIGWLTGLVTAALFRHRTRGPR